MHILEKNKVKINYLIISSSQNGHHNLKEGNK